ncbi:MAG: S-layer homology domain-containing protein [Thermomicrobiales bacterium]
MVLTVVPVSGGQAGASPAGPYHPGQSVTITATPGPGQLFLGWQYGVGSSGLGGVQITSWDNPLVVTLQGDLTVTPVFGALPAFGDVAPNHAAYAAITRLAGLGVIKGYGNGNFGPDDTTQRAQMAALIARAMGWDQEDHGNPFVDGAGISPGLWRNVGTLAYYGVAYGYDPTHFAPTDRVTQAQTISFITRAMVKKGFWTKVTVDQPNLFPNVTFASGHRWDLLTFYAYVGAPPDSTPAAAWGTWQTPATRGWFARALQQAMDSVYGR